jgi:transaldolase
MEIFVDSANYKEIETWFRQGVVDGVTTNPSIVLKDGVFDIEEHIKRICQLLGDRPVSVEVTTNDREEMLDQARTFAKWALNVVVKIPVINEQGESCLGVIHQLREEGIRINCTAILSFNQAILASKAGATYVSIFAGRVADEGGDASLIIRSVRSWLDLWKSPSKIIVGSIRTTLDVQSAAMAGAHIVTIPPQFLPKMVDHKYSRDTVRGFVADARKAMEVIEKELAARGRR